MTLEWRPLPWDTEFFGVPIGSAELDGADEASLAVLEAEARAQGIVCLYGSLDPGETATSYLLQASGWRFVDAPTMLELLPELPPIPVPADTEIRLGTSDDVAEVLPIARKMAAWSRYAVDPRFGVAEAERLNEAWLRRAASGESGRHSLVVAQTDGEITALVGRVDDELRIDGIGAAGRGTGAAGALVQYCRPWAGDQPLLGGPIAARNLRAMRFVTSCGYRPCQVDYLFHRWLDDDNGRHR